MKYYWESNSKAVGVCRYKTDKLLSTEIVYVTAAEFSSLKYPRWINGVIIDAYVASYIDEWEDFTAISTDKTIWILGDDSEFKTKKRNDTIFKLKNNIGKKVIMPYLYLSHWYLLYL